MRPKLKGDTFFISVPDGILLRNNRGSQVMKGKVVYSWVERLAPYLDGTHTLDELTEGLDAEKSAMVRNLVDALAAGAFLRDADQDLPHTLTAAELETYAAEIAFVESFHDSAARSFASLRTQRVLLIGSGLLFTALVHASLSCGLRQIDALALGEDPTPWRHVRDELEQFQQRDSTQTVTQIDAPDWSDETAVLAAIEPYDAILFAADTPLLAYLQRLNALCTTHRKLLIPAVIVDEHTWLGPLVNGDPGTCWECAWRRLQSNRGDARSDTYTDALANRLDGTASQFLTLPTAAIVADQLTFELFKHITGAGPLETAGNLIDLDLETAYSQAHAFVPHPLCSACQQSGAPTAAEFLDSIGQLQQREPDTTHIFSQRASSLFDQELGLFTALDEADLLQLPLATCRVSFSNPMRNSASALQTQVIGASVSFKAARHDATRQACEFYAASVVNRQRLIHCNSSVLEAPSIAHERILRVWGDEHLADPSPSRSPSPSWTWAYSLADERAYLVPAAAAFPALDGVLHATQVRLGVGSGMTWSEAVCHGMLSLCRQLTLRRLQEGCEPYPLVDLAAIPLEPEGTRQRHLLNQVSSWVTVYDVTGPLHVPTFAICTNEDVVAYSTHTDVARALRAGFEAAHLHAQLIRQGQMADYGLPDVPALPLSLRGVTTVVPHSVAPQEDEACLGWLQQTFAEAGWQALVVPLDHDPALAGVLPCLVRVLLAHA